MLTSLLERERCRVTLAICNLKKSIAVLGTLVPRTPKIEAALREAKETERQLCEAAKDPAFLKNLVERSLRKIHKTADSLSKAQSKRASKPRKTRGITPQERNLRNQKMIEHFKKSRLSINGFAIRHEAKYKLKTSQIRSIISK